jgi:peptidoglycan/LPS O-acetylase OafA/YrhL
MTAVTTPPAASATTHSSRRWRGDVEGLRAVAVALVLADHAAPGPSGGFLGVDLFFVVSGFVITTQLVREVERDRRLSLTRFYARRATRLLPAAGLVLLTTAVLTWFLAPRTQRGTFGLDIAGAAGYVVNWVFADRSVDYLAEDLDPSPVLHFWSLAVEEQFYLVWPLAILLVLALRRARWGSTRTALAVGLGVLIIVPTFLWSVHLTAVDPERAFFVTTTRLWEMGIGAFVALGARRWERPPALPAAVLGWLGLAGPGIAAVTYSSSTAWPGFAALLPTAPRGRPAAPGGGPSTSRQERKVPRTGRSTTG